MEKWYHGSSSNFDSFKHQAIGTNGRAQGFGIYLTQSKEVARSYAGTGKGHENQGFVYHVDTSKINDMRQLDPEQVTMTQEDVVQILKSITEVQDEYPYTLVDYSGNPDLEVGWNEENEEIAQEIAFNLLEDEANDLDVINELRNLSNESEAVGRGLSQAIIGSAPDWTQVDSEGHPALVVFDPNNLSIIEKESVHEPQLVQEQTIQPELTADDAEYLSTLSEIELHQ
ncbi:ADP-ribosyltransferase-containing protein [Fructobacillus tropaeoli]|uniref:ADP-ribosyltransferase-containing protein n=1 Tax=Fructobacillus tropaeoli TaxID=709323 RepID=UPI0019411046|nr:hypothetical protein [Fructobacillus tropaeoli]GIC69394.1 hypothetical protein FT12353_00300 [Fructobacillus tropaeoli]